MSCNQTPFHKWKIEVDEISFELDCTNSNGTQPNKATLSLLLDLKEVKKDLLLDESSRVEGDVKVTLKGNNGESLWPKELSGILIKKNQYGGSLSVNYYQLSSRGTTGRMGSTVLNHNLFQENKFICNFGGAVRGDSERELYRGGYLKGSTSMLLSNTNTPWKVHISIDKCDKVDNLSEMKQTTCNLKVTDGNDLDWSTKVKAKARISFE